MAGCLLLLVLHLLLLLVLLLALPLILPLFSQQQFQLKLAQLLEKPWLIL